MYATEVKKWNKYLGKAPIIIIVTSLMLTGCADGTTETYSDGYDQK